MKTDELNSLNDSDNEQIDKTVNDDPSKTEEENSNDTTSVSEEAPENYENSDQTTQTSVGDEDSSSSSDTVEQSESLEDPNNLEKMILSTGIRVGTPIKTKFMTSFITRANPEGLYILDISKTLARIDVAAKFIGRTNIANVAVTSAREYGKTPIEKFCELTGARGIFGRFMPGTFTNPSLPKYLEPEIVIVTDPQADEQAVLEATRAGVPVIALSNSDNITSKVDLVIPSNNRGRKALATVYWLLTKEVLKKQGKIKSDSEMSLTIDDFEAKLVEELI
ncbi:MAG TPA: 30S ribosomal protein S2 [Candidatus Nitrosocosmicus sp.]|nr:30S ribosomal protein S2 [Candidatus Nitrosocosmicus sp.]